MAYALTTTMRLRRLIAAAIAASLGALLAATPLLGSRPVMLIAPGSSWSGTSATAIYDLPAPLRAAVSAAMGTAQSGYRMTVAAGGFEGVNPAQHLRVRRAPLGIAVQYDNGPEMRLRLAAAELDGSAIALANVAARVRENRVVYDAGDVRQSFVNGPLGVEQRFLVRRARGVSGASLALEVDVSRGVGVSLSADRRSATLAARGGRTFRYSGLAATDAGRRSLPARMRLQRDRLVLEVQTRGARFPITVDPLLSPYAMLTGPSGLTSRFGSGIALSTDGNTAAIGGESDNGGVGAVWVFTRSGSTWAQQGPKLTPSGDNLLPASRGAEHFGSSVAISGNGDTILVGAGRLVPLAAWVFVRASGVWHQQGPQLKPRAPTHEISEGDAIALSGDGRTAVVAGNVGNRPLTWIYAFSRGRWRQLGRPLHTSGRYTALSANGNTLLLGSRVSVRSGSRWRAAGTLSYGPGAEGFSYPTALSADGKTALLANSQRGYALVYRRSHGRWIRVARLTSPHPEAQVSFAGGVTLSADGNTALIAASARTEPSGEKPVGYIFTSTNGDVWTSTAALIMNQPWSAALSADGSTIIAPPLLREVGERIETSGGPAQVFTRAGNRWQEQPAIAPSDATGVDSGSFGGNFAISSDARTALVSEGAGVAWVFSRTGESWARQARLQVENTVGAGALVALSADGNTAVLAGPSAPGPVAAWAFFRTGGAWSASATPLIASGAGPRPPGSREELESFATSVAVSANGDVILVGADWDSGHTGAVWIFTRSGTGWTQQGPKRTPTVQQPEERFGNSVSLSANSEVVLVGAVGRRERPQEGSGPEGAAYVFTRSRAALMQAAKLIDSEHLRYEIRRGLGNTVALSADGNTALLGGHDYALVFTRTPSGWQQHRPPLTPSPTEHNANGGGKNVLDAVVALSADGSRAVLGGPVEQGCGRYFNESCTGTAAVWAFSRFGEAWVRQPLPLVHELPFGAQVAISGNGEAVLIRGVTPGSEPGGAVFVSQLTTPPQAGFVIEPWQVEDYGAIELDLWSYSAATFTATARVIAPRAREPSVRSPCNRAQHLKRSTRRRPCASGGFPVYGVGKAKGIENVALALAPRPAMRRYLANHKRVRLLITITERPSAPAPASTQTITLGVPYKKPLPSQF
jgi:hypothetical protein